MVIYRIAGQDNNRYEYRPGPFITEMRMSWKKLNEDKGDRLNILRH